MEKEEGTGILLRSIFFWVLYAVCLMSVGAAFIAYLFGYERAFSFNQRVLYFTLLAVPGGLSMYSFATGKWRTFSKTLTIIVIPCVTFYFWFASPPHLIPKTIKVLAAIKNQSAFSQYSQNGEAEMNWLKLNIPFFQKEVDKGWTKFLSDRIRTYQSEPASDNLIAYLSVFEWVRETESSRYVREQSLDWPFIEHDLRALQEIRQEDVAFKSALSRSDFASAKITLEHLVEMQRQLPTESRCRDIVTHLVDDYSLCLHLENILKSAKEPD